MIRCMDGTGDALKTTLFAFRSLYHQAIDFAIAHGLSTVEAGAQGEHKLSRGYLPVTTHSAHYISHPAASGGFRLSCP